MMDQQTINFLRAIREARLHSRNLIDVLHVKTVIKRFPDLARSKSLNLILFGRIAYDNNIRCSHCKELCLAGCGARLDYHIEWITGSNTKPFGVLKSAYCLDCVLKIFPDSYKMKIADFECPEESVCNALHFTRNIDVHETLF